MTRSFVKAHFRGYAAISTKQEAQAAYESNSKTETNRLEKTLSKFWEKVSIKQTGENSYAVQLDSKVIKTPLGYDMLVPENRKTLAYLLANEWQTLPSLHIRPYLVPLTSLVSRCIDLDQARLSEDLEMRAKVGDLSTVKSLLLRYLDTDTLCVFSPLEDCDGELRKQQEQYYLPFIKEMGEFLGKYSKDGKPVEVTYLDSEKDGLVGNTQPAATREAASAFLNGLDMWDLVALEKATLTAKSFLIGVAIVRNSDPNDSFNVSVEELSRLANLETVLQTARWGEVEDTHDVDKVDVKRNLASASLIAHKA